MLNRFVMIMVGLDGVGKTTLLSTMYHELSRIDNPAGFEVAASEDTHRDLHDAYKKLSTILAQPTFTPTWPLLKGTAGIVERQFEILFKGKKELELVLCDIAGGLVRAKEGNPDFDELKNKLEEAIVIMNVIDGSVLVEGDELLSIQKNDPAQIYKLLLPILRQGKNYLILFVITKCEAWLKNEKTRKQLETAFETQYEMILKLIEGLDNVVGVLEKEVIFVRKPNLRFKPVDIEQPQRYALAFALVQHNQHRSQWNKFMRWFWNEDVAFQKALTEFAEGRSRSFKIYGNLSLIEVTES